MSVLHIGLVLDHLKAPPPVKLVAIILADHADADGVCWPSYRRLAERSCLSERTVRRCVRELLERGMLAKLDTGHGPAKGEAASSWTSNLYRIDAAALGALPRLLTARPTEGAPSAAVRPEPDAPGSDDQDQEGVVVTSGHDPEGGGHGWPPGGGQEPSGVVVTGGHQTVSRTTTVNHQAPPIVPPTLFDAFWDVWPNRKGSKKLARQRFSAMTAAKQQRCLAAARHFATAAAAGIIDPTYQPRAENFIGGSKSYWEEWEDGRPAHYAAARPRNVSAADLLNLADALDSQEALP